MAQSIDQRKTITLTGLLLFLLVLLAMTFVLVWSDATLKIDRLLHDSWVRYDQREVPSDVIIAAIDSDSLNELGRWPWSRELQAELFEQLAGYGPRLVVSDLLYTEASENRSNDIRLGKAIGALPKSVLPVLTEGGGGRISRESLPVPDITRHVDGLGHIFLPIDDDGIVRRIFLRAGINQAHWPSLSMAALEMLGPLPDPLPGAVRQLPLSSGQWVQNNEVYIPFYGPNGSFRRVSAIDIVRGALSPDRLRDKIVFVGLTTTGLGDVVPTPVSALDQPVPGVEIHANIFSSLRDGSLVTKVSRYAALWMALLLLPPMLLVYSRAPPEWGLVSALVGSAIPVLISFGLYVFANIWLAPLAASVPILASYLFWSRHRLQYVNRFLEQERLKSLEVLPQRVVSDNVALQSFFTSASRHLPILGWRFSVGQEHFAGGDALPVAQPSEVENRWSVADGLFTRRYPAAQGLLIEMHVEDDATGEQIAQYIDSLARVRAREQATLLSGSIERLQTNVLNLSEQIEWLRSVKDFSDTMLSATPTGFAVWNPAGECIRANPLLYWLVEGFPDRGDLIDFIISLGRDPELEDNDAHFKDLVLRRKPWQIAYRKDERELIVNFRAVGQSLAQRLICVSVVDVSEIRTAEKARAEMVDYLSHDLRSPLISALSLLDEEGDSSVESGVERNIRTSLAMMDDLLHIARADDLTDAQFAPLLLNSVLDNTLDQLLPQARMQGIDFDIQTVDDDLWVVGDAASLERAFTNIVGNAIKYSSSGTVVTVRLIDEEGLARLTVDDEGAGIDPAMLGQLFTRFKRDAKTASDHQGIGLGLALVARVVNLHGGHVMASNLPVGTRVTLDIPLEEPDSEGLITTPSLEHELQR